jgi:2'-5' RNA ligase
MPGMLTAVVVPVPAAEPVVAAWRERLDPSAAAGMPAHVTALYPFLPGVTAGVLATLKGLCASLPALEVRFRRTGRFPGVLYLAPEPVAELRRLTEALASRWPEAPPYGGAFEDIVPHLTVAVGDDLDPVEAAVKADLPIRARLEEAWLYGHVNGRWQPHARLPFRGR